MSTQSVVEQSTISIPLREIRVVLFKQFELCLRTVEALRRDGQKTPLVVRAGATGWELVRGHHVFVAGRWLGLSHLECRVVPP